MRVLAERARCRRTRNDGARCKHAIAALMVRSCMRCGPPESTAGRRVLHEDRGASRWNSFPCRKQPSGRDFARVCGAGHAWHVCATPARRRWRRCAGRSRRRLTRRTLSSTAGMSAHQLERAFRTVMGISPRQYADARRMRRLKSRLRKGDDVTTALYDAGFGSSSRLYEPAPAQLGMTPATYRHGGAGMKIRYTIVSSPLGRLLVGATERGISALYLGKDDGSLENSLRKEYPRAEIRRDRNGLEGWVGKILAHVRGREPNLDLPTDVQATAFQRRVWEELRKIPYGTTRTYSQVARAIGKPTAIRAVARACATNPVSVVVPCHRVLREDGNLAGYRWGLERKQALLEHESAKRGETTQRKSAK